MVMSWKRSSYSGDDGGNCVEVGFDWRKSSYSDNDGGNCVEVAARWQKSSHSGNNGGDCVEVGTAGPSAPHVLVRDSKRAAEADTPVLHLAPAAFAAFLAAARTA